MGAVSASRCCGSPAGRTDTRGRRGRRGHRRVDRSRPHAAPGPPNPLSRLRLLPGQPGDQLVRGGVRVELARRRPARPARPGAGPPCRSPMRARSAVTAIASISSRRAARRRSAQLAVLLHPGPVLVERLDHLVDALAARGDGLDDRRPPAPGPRASPRPEHVAQVADGGVGAVAVGLVDHEHVGDLQDAGLRRLDAVAHAGREQHDRGVGQRGDLDLGLADADRLDQHHVAAGGVQHPDRLRRGPGQAAEVAAGGHRADVDAGVGGVVLHPDPVAEQRAAGERRRRVDGQHADPLPALAVARATSADGRGRLADAGRPGQADDVGAARRSGASAAMTSRSCGTRPRPARSAGPRPAAGPRGPARPAGTSPSRRSGLTTVPASTVRGHPSRRPATAGLDVSPGRAGSARRPGRRRRTAPAAPMPPPRRLQLERQVQRDARAGHADRVAQRDRAAVDVDLFGSMPRSCIDCDADRRERLVDLDRGPGRRRSRPSLASACLMALAGWDCSELSGPATLPCAPISASQVRPSSSALALLMTTTAAAPSEICEAVPAVIVPSLANAGRSRPATRRWCPGGRPRPR